MLVDLQSQYIYFVLKYGIHSLVVLDINLIFLICEKMLQSETYTHLNHWNVKLSYSNACNLNKISSCLTNIQLELRSCCAHIGIF